MDKNDKSGMTFVGAFMLLVIGAVAKSWILLLVGVLLLLKACL